MDLDDLFPKIGEFGKYQKLVFWCALVPTLLGNSFVAFNQLFMDETPQHWCRVPVLESILDSETRKLYTIPLKKGSDQEYEKCARYAVNWTKILEDDPKLTNFKPNTSWPLESCFDGWEYNLTEISSSVVIDFDLVCEKSLYPTYALAVLNMGGSVGAFVFGLINNRYGRKLAYLLSVGLAFFANTFSAFSTNVIVWLLTRFCIGLILPALYQIQFIVALEIVGPNYRSFISMAAGLIFTTGTMVLAGITYFIPNWRIMALATSAPFVTIAITWWFLPESPRWLLAVKRNEEAETIMRKIAKVNKKYYPSSFVTEKEMMPLKQDGKTKNKLEENKKIGFLDLFRTPNMRLKSILIAFLWFVNDLVYWGLSYYGPALGNEAHLSFFLSGLAEFPGNAICLYILEIFGRKCPFSTLMITSGISCILTVLLPSNAVISILVLFLIAKFAIGTSFLILYTFAGEIFPTETRAIGLAMACYLSGVGRIFVPFINHLGADMVSLPMVILGTFATIGGILSLRLPETLHQPLPQTVEDGERFGKDWTIANCCQCIPSKILRRKGDRE